jgi:hypothetical protein
MKTNFAKFAGAALMLALVPFMGSSGLSAPAHAQASAKADPVAFFTGTTISKGTIKEALSASKGTRAVSKGTMQPDGSMIIKQSVHIGDDPVRNRTWRLRQTSGGKVTGSISDATSPVTGTISGNAMTLSYKLEGGLKVSQVLTLAADGRTCSNEMKIRKFGIVVARLSEVITRQ